MTQQENGYITSHYMYKNTASILMDGILLSGILLVLIVPPNGQDSFQEHHLPTKRKEKKHEYYDIANKRSLEQSLIQNYMI